MVVGDGVIGMSVALRLADEGLNVTVIGQKNAGQASWASGGMLSALPPWETPPLMEELVNASLADYDTWIASIERRSGVSCELITTGLLTIPPFDGDTPLQWAKKSDEAEIVNARDIEPGLAEDGDAIWEPNARQLRSPRLLKALKGALEHAGIQQHLGGASGLKTQNGKVVAVETPDGDVHADMCVMCAGAWGGAILADMPGGAPALRPIRGQILLYRPDEKDVPKTTLMRKSIYLIPRADGGIVTGSTLEDVGFDPSNTAEAEAYIAEEAGDILPALRGATPETRWAGLRPKADRGVPFICRHPDISNLLVSMGHYRYGVILAPGNAQLIADLATERTPKVDPTPFAW